MCSIQLLSNNIFNIPTSKKSVTLGLLMWLRRKKSIVLVKIGQISPEKNQHSQDIMNAEKDEHFFNGSFLFYHIAYHLQKMFIF
jgi:hypothetical protein